MAAALALDSGSSIQKTDVAKLQKSLADAGVLLRRSELQHL